jgi:hypothetical protein
MTHSHDREEPDNRTRADYGRAALDLFATLLCPEGTDDAADARSISLLVPRLIGALLHLLAAENVPLGPVIDQAIACYAADSGQDFAAGHGPIALLRRIYMTIREEGPGITPEWRLDEMWLLLQDQGWTDYGSPFGL